MNKKQRTAGKMETRRRVEGNGLFLPLIQLAAISSQIHGDKEQHKKVKRFQFVPVSAILINNLTPIKLVEASGCIIFVGVSAFNLYFPFVFCWLQNKLMLGNDTVKLEFKLCHYWQ